MRTLLTILALCSLSFAQTTIFPKTTVFPKTTIFGAAASGIPALDATSPTNCRTTSVTSQTCTLAVTVNDQILVGLYIGVPSTPNLSGTTGKCDGAYPLSTAAATNSFYATSSATGTGLCTITLNNGASGTLGLIAISIKNTSGIDAFAPASSLTNDSFHGAGAACPSTLTFTFPSVTTTVANDLVIGLALDSDSNTGVFSTCNGAWTKIQSTTQPTAGFEAATQLTPGSVTPGVAVFSTGSTPQVVTIAYKP